MTVEQEKAKKYKDPSFLEKERNELEKLYKDILSFEENVMDGYTQAKNNRASGSGKFITEQTENLISLKKTRLDVIHEKVNINKILADYEFKDKDNLSEDEKNNQIFTQFARVLDSKRPINLINENTSEEDSEDEISNLLNKRVEELKKIGKIEFTPEDNAIKYEKVGVTIKVRILEDDEWEFAAYNNETGKRIKDYPLPDDEDYEIELKTFKNGKTIAVDRNSGKEFAVKYKKRK